MTLSANRVSIPTQSCISADLTTVLRRDLSVPGVVAYIDMLASVVPVHVNPGTGSDGKHFCLKDR